MGTMASHVTSGIDNNLHRAAIAQAFRGSINHITFRDAPEIDPQWLVKRHSSLRQQLNVVP